MLFHLPTIITVMIDIAVWFAIHMGVSYIMTRMPAHSFNPNSWLYRTRNWERNGKIYHKTSGKDAYGIPLYINNLPWEKG